MSALVEAIGLVAQPEVLIAILLASVDGLAVGSLPGLSATMATALTGRTELTVAAQPTSSASPVKTRSSARHQLHGASEALAARGNHQPRHLVHRRRQFRTVLCPERFAPRSAGGSRRCSSRRWPLPKCMAALMRFTAAGRLVLTISVSPTPR